MYLSQPGLGPVPGARVLAEFGDDRHRYAGPEARKNYAGTAPNHPGLGHPAGRAGPLSPQPAARRRPLPPGLHRTGRLTRSPGLLRPTMRPQRPPTIAPWSTD